ncbi:TPA: hypothetical protein ACH3X2_011114 [Trebouxia sp. C0005]
MGSVHHNKAIVKPPVNEVIISMGHQASLWLTSLCFNFRLDADPANWMDGGSWEGTMSDLLWDEDGEMFRCSSRPAAWHPPNKMTGRQSHDSLLSLKRLLLYPDMMYGYYPERLPPTQGEADKRRGVRIEMGGMMRSEKVFRRLILRYAATGEVLSVTEEVYRPQR